MYHQLKMWKEPGTTDIPPNGEMVSCAIDMNDSGDDPKISELTVSQLQTLIRRTVQEAVAEVIIEFSMAAEMDAQLTYEAEMADYLRAALNPQFNDNDLVRQQLDD